MLKKNQELSSVPLLRQNMKATIRFVDLHWEIVLDTKNGHQ